MNPKDLITPKIIDYCKSLPLIFILGPTKSGKVTISKELSKQLDNRELLIADEYIENYGYEYALDRLESDMKDHYYNCVPVILEGILCFRLLRKMVKEGYHLPNITIKVECNQETISFFYEKEEPGKNLNSVMGFNQGLEKIFKESVYLLESQGKKLPILTLNTSIY